MDWALETAARLVRAAHMVWTRKGAFLAAFAFVFSISLTALSLAGLVPEQHTVSAGALTSDPIVVSASSTQADSTPAPAEEPVKITAASIGLSASIKNPMSTDIALLDKALLQGAVRYPTSAKLGESGNVVLFGHSSYLPIVHNQAYKTFDGIQKLKPGDVLTVYSSDRAYTYAVRSVVKENAASGVIPLAVAGRTLTLATCDSFGTKSDRFVVTAEFVESHALSS